jgi:glycosidase
MRHFIVLVTGVLLSLQLSAQFITSSPQFITEASSNVEISFDASFGNKAFVNYPTPTDVYVHIGVITSRSTSSTDWRYVKFAWGTANPAAQCTSLGGGKWKYTIGQPLRTFFNITDAGETITRISILFRNGTGTVIQRNTDGTDMYVPVYTSGLQVRIDQPLREPTFSGGFEPITKGVGETLTVTANTSSNANITLTYGSNTSSATNARTLTQTFTIASPGQQTITASATDGSSTVTDVLSFFVSGGVPVAPLPAGVKDGINYGSGGTSATLVLFAPGKSNVFVLGDFNNWTQRAEYQMNRTPDGNRFWITLTGLSSGFEYAYQYLVDGSLKVADYNAEKVLDPNNDNFIPPATYPNLKAYPTGKTTGIVSVLQTNKPQYNWKVTNFTRPDKRNLVVYELLLRDLLATQNWQTLRDTLNYFTRLGVNVLHVMPFTEFEGNLSWGYNPSYFFAPDKYYGTENALREFIDSAHSKGIAVVLDLVMNHAFGQSPLVQLYWDATAGKPAANSPWFNPDARHPFNVGYDFNHESQATRDLVDRVVEHWLTSYKLDGFRWDLSKGFTQINNPTNVSAWGAYDAGRINTWKRINNKMQSVSPGSYCILEHFADNTEEKELSDAGMLLWGNLNYSFNEATMGYTSTSNFDGALHTKRGWANPHLMSYAESHDEERLMYKNISFGTGSGSYNVRDLNTALKRNEAAAAFLLMMPGPKLIWQFGELGYDISITACTNGTVPPPYPNMQCRLDNKPPKWDYLQNANRLALFNVYASLNRLRLTPNFAPTFTGSNVSTDLTGAFKWMTVQSDSLRVVVVGNFDVVARSGTVTFPQAGPWYSYLTNTVRNATGGAESITLQPGEYFVYVNRNITNPIITSVDDLRPDYTSRSLIIYPNPVTLSSVLVYEIPEPGRVNLSIWNMQGQKVGAMDAGMKGRGRHEAKLSGMTSAMNRMPAGSYVMLLDVNGKQMRKQFVINP